MYWLLEKAIFDRMVQAQSFAVVPTAEQQAALEARTRMGGGGSSPLLTVTGDTAKIAIEGVLTPKPNFLAFILGGGNTTYEEIISAVAEAESLDQVKNITLAIDSPGGNTEGLFAAIEALQAATKPMTAVVSGSAASAAFAIASQAETIVAMNRGAIFGSIGIMAKFPILDNEVVVTSTNAPDKSPDASTEEGQATIRKMLDATHNLFAEAIATGRGVTVDTVNEKFGRGAPVLADSALERGMIDSVETIAVTSNGAQAISNNPKPIASIEPKTNQARKSMELDLETFKAQHSALFAQVRELGVAHERDRVVAHLKLGESSGDMKTASAAIKDGSDMTQTLTATYHAASMNRNDVDTRQGDNSNAADGATGGDEDPAEIEAQQVLANVSSQLGGIADA